MYYYTTFVTEKTLLLDAKLNRMHPIEWMIEVNKHNKKEGKPLIIINSFFEITKEQYDMLDSIL